MLVEFATVDSHKTPTAVPVAFPPITDITLLVIFWMNVPIGVFENAGQKTPLNVPDVVPALELVILL